MSLSGHLRAAAGSEVDVTDVKILLHQVKEDRLGIFTFWWKIWVSHSPALSLVPHCFSSLGTFILSFSCCLSSLDRDHRQMSGAAESVCGGVGGNGTGLTSVVIIVISLDRPVIRARTRTKPGLPERKKSRGRYRKT